MQLDLFLHSADVGLRNAVVEALRCRDLGTMREAIDRLRNDFPNDNSLAGFEQVFSELSALGRLTPSPSPTAIVGQLERIDSQLLPPLQKLIGGSDAARRWLEPVYADLARAVAGQPFVRSLASVHATALFLKAGALPEARAALSAIASWRRIPEPLAWMAEIALRENKPAEFWPLLAELAWTAPALLDATLTGLPESEIPASVLCRYREFGAQADLDGDDEIHEAEWFPAWLLVEHSELLPLLRGANAHIHDSRPARSVVLLVDLLTGERHGAAPTMADQRKQLRDLAPPLFARYMARR